MSAATGTCTIPTRAALLPIKDVLSQLEPFIESTDKHAGVMDSKAFINFHAWFEASVWKLELANVPANLHVHCLCQKLAGPALKMFSQKQLIERWNTADMTTQSFRVRFCYKNCHDDFE